MLLHIISEISLPAHVELVISVCLSVCLKFYFVTNVNSFDQAGDKKILTKIN